MDRRSLMLGAAVAALMRIVPSREITADFVADFGAVPDGKTNNAAAMDRAIAWCRAMGPNAVVIAPPGRYVIA